MLRGSKLIAFSKLPSQFVEIVDYSTKLNKSLYKFKAPGNAVSQSFISLHLKHFVLVSSTTSFLELKDNILISSLFSI